jgi:adenine/guanine phosphoribosyltransferase-like PRPP-binding protein
MWLLPVLDRVCSLAARSYYRLYIEGESVPAEGPVLLVDDFTESGWTLAVAGRLLLGAGATEVLPLVLAVQS